jgi:ketosteroid isomerase-like protein
MLSIACTGGSNSLAFETQSLQDIENQIWALEEAYISAYKGAEHANILALLHEQFLGWPDPEEWPTTKKKVARFLQDKYPTPADWDFVIDQAGIQIHGNVGITQYVLVLTGKDKEGTIKKKVTRITHTWVKEGSEWKILGGMSNVQ